MITLDCVRPDFLGCYGNTRVSTPNMDRLATQGLCCEQTITQSPCTWVSHAGIFTGFYPPVHGLRAPLDRLSEPVTTLAEVLSEAGFQTAGFPANDLVGSRTGLNRGFDLYFEDYPEDRGNGLTANRRNTWSGILNKAETWIKTRHQRFFAWFHYLDTHHLPECDLPPYYRLNFNPDWQFYEGKISYADEAAVGRILSLLERCGLTRETLIILFGDHGEDLGGDGLPRHNGELTDSVLRVPLIIAGAGGGAPVSRVTRQTRTVDILPTALGLLGVSSPPGLDGNDLLQDSSLTDPLDPQSSLAYAENFPLGLETVRSQEWKFVRGNQGKALFHLSNDPAEQQNVLDMNPLTGDFFEKQMEAITRRSQFVKSVTPPEAGKEHRETTPEAYQRTMETLQGLGYL